MCVRGGGGVLVCVHLDECVGGGGGVGVCGGVCAFGCVCACT